MEDPLDVLVLLERVDQLEHLLGLILGELDGVWATYSSSAEMSGSLRSSSAACRSPKLLKAQRITSSFSPFSPVPSPISSSPWSISSSSSSSWSTPSGESRKTPIR